MKLQQALLLVLGSSMLYSSSCQAQTLDCSFQEDLDVRGDGSLLVRRVINQNDQTVTVQLEYAGEGWLGFAFTEQPIMVPNTAVIGLPDTGVVQKYDLAARSLVNVTVAADSSSLTQQSITQANGVTTLTFTKPLVETGQVAVVAGAENRFNWALGFSNALNTHLARGSVVANFPECLVVTEPPVAAPVAPVASPPTWTSPTPRPVAPPPTWSPTEAPTVAPVTQAPVDASTLDCSFQNELDIVGDGTLLLRRIINQADQTVTVELEYAGEAWLGFAFSETPAMVINRAVIGLPDTGGTGVVEKYDLAARFLVNVTVAADSSSLMDQSIIQADGITILKFTKPLVEEGEVSVAAGDNVRFNWAYGSSNTLGVHAARGSVETSFPECLEAGETAAPVAAPTVAAAPGVVDLGDGRLQATIEGEGLEIVLTTNEPAGTITVEMTYAGDAWIAFGFSEDGFMPGSKAVIALPDSNTAQQYDLNDRNLNGVVPLSTQTLLDSSVSQENDVTILTFTKLLEEPGEPPISLTDDSIFLYAIGMGNTLDVHQIRAAVTLSGNISISDNQGLWKAHGICMAVSWAILVPLAIGSSVIRDILPLPEGMWFQIHRALNVTAILLTIAGFSIAVHLFNEVKRDHFTPETHFKVGLTVFIFAVLQGLSGIFRPHAPHKPDPKDESDDPKEEGDEEVEPEETTSDDAPAEDAPVEKTKIRTIWEYQHRILGTVALVLGWYNCDSGLELFQTRFGGKNLEGALWGVIAGITVTTLLLSLYIRFVKKPQ